jgi:phosphate-selective porin OprO and OprP
MRLTLFMLAAAIAAFPIAAQDVPDPDAPSVASASGARLTIGGFLQADARLVAGDDGASGPLLRRARLVFDATGDNGFRLRLVPDFGQGRVLIQDALVGWRGVGKDVRVGRFRPTFGGERTRSSSTLLFPERGLINTLMPPRATGVQATLGDSRRAVVLGAFRTALGADAQTVDTDGDLTLAPSPTQEALVRLQGALGRLDGGRGTSWHVSVLAGAARGLRTDGTGPARLLTPGQRPLFAYVSTGPDPVVADGRRWRAVAGIEHVARQDAWHLELITAEDGVRRVATGRAALLHGGAAMAWSRVWRGVRAADYVVTPSDDRGAIEAGWRLGAAWVDPDAVRRFGAVGAAGRGLSGGVAVSWLPSAATRISVAYDLTREDRGAQRTEHAMVLRVQQGF